MNLPDNYHHNVNGDDDVNDDDNVNDDDSVMLMMTTMLMLIIAMIMMTVLMILTMLMLMMTKTDHQLLSNRSPQSHQGRHWCHHGTKPDHNDCNHD